MKTVLQSAFCSTSPSRLGQHLACALLAFCFLLPSEGWADRLPDSGKAREHVDKITGRVLYLDLAGSYQGLGAVVRTRLGYKWRLFGHKSAVLKNNFISLHGIAQVSPAYANVGAGLIIQPLSIFSISATYMYRLHFPTFTSGTLFKDKAAINSRYQGVNGFSDGEERLDNQLTQVLKANGDSRPFVHGHLINVSATFQIKLKGIVFAASAGFSFNFLDFEDVDNSQFLYEPFADVITGKTDTIFNLSLIGGYEWRSLLFLVIYSHTISLAAESQRALVGPGIRWEFTKQWRGLRKPYLLFLVRWYTNHRWRISPLPNIAFVVGTNF